MSEKLDVPVCPRCNSRNIKERVVGMPPNRRFYEISLDEYAKQRIEALQPKIPTVSGGPLLDIERISGDVILQNNTQLVLRCESCGYTKVYDITKKEK